LLSHPFSRSASAAERFGSSASSFAVTRGDPLITARGGPRVGPEDADARDAMEQRVTRGDPLITASQDNTKKNCIASLKNNADAHALI
jgi:hypothetical protein